MSKAHVQPRTPNQEFCIDSIREKDVTFLMGPPGTGKTVFAVGLAVQYLLEGKIEKIVITRPIMGAGEDPGALPGGVDQKIHPFLIPIFEELKGFATKTDISTWKKEKIIDVVPLAYMRGRNFHKSFIILDEAQNTTYNQLKMVITRLGIGSKLVINGDVQQTDLKISQAGGLEKVSRALQYSNRVGVCHLNKNDIVRNKLIAELVDLLEEHCE